MEKGDLAYYSRERLMVYRVHCDANKAWQPCRNRVYDVGSGRDLAKKERISQVSWCCWREVRKALHVWIVSLYYLATRLGASSAV